MCICVYMCVCVYIYIYEIKRCLLLGRRAMISLDSVLKSRDITLLTKVRIVKAVVFPVVMYGCESWTINKAEHRRTDAFSELWCWRKLLIKPVDPKGNQPWILIAGTDAEASILWPPDVKSWLTGKDPDAGKDWGHEEKGMTEDEMIGLYHQLNGHEFEQTVGDSERQGSLACCSPWSLKDLDVTDWTKKIYPYTHNWITLVYSGN